MRRLVKDTSGETIVETLAAMIICALSIALLVTAVVTSARLNGQAAQSRSDVSSQEEKAEGNGGFDGSTVPTGEVTVTATNADGSTSSHVYTVAFSGGDDLVSYHVTGVPE